MSFQPYTALSVEKTLQQFEQNATSGYCSKQIPDLQRKFGKNTLVTNSVSWYHIFFRQFKSAFIYILLFAILITFLLGEYIDGAFILFFVLINVFLGFFQEYKSVQITQYLGSYTKKRAVVTRDSDEQIINAEELVPGDIVVVETGDIIPADLRLIDVENLTLDESTLTGETVKVNKNAAPLQSPVDQTYKAQNIAFSGTTVTEGKGTGIVIATGSHSQLGKIAKLSNQIQETSSFERQINKFSEFILYLILGTLALVFIVQILFKHNLTVAEIAVYSIALAVGVIPEGMPLVTTFSLSLGAKKLADKKVVVKRLSAIEDLGSIEVLCTDKTGTITENKLSVSEVYSQNVELTLALGVLAASSTEKEKTANNSFDLAFMSQLADADNMLHKHKRLYEIPFNPNRRRNSVLIRYETTNKLIVRGAVEAVMPYVTGLSENEQKDVIDWTLKQGALGKRVVALATKDISADKYSIEDETTGLIFCGLVSFEDPVKPTTTLAIQQAKDLGVITKLITGDSLEVATAVGMRVCLIKNATEAITGDALQALSPQQQREMAIKLNVFARMSPTQKHDLIKILQESYSVGFLGEGINDSPALKAAGVSIVVDNAADVSREIADIILLEHDLQVIVEGIAFGRKTFVNVTNYIKATLASNFGNFYAMAFVTLLINYLPMLPIQLLLVNLLSDFPMLSIAADNVDKQEILKPKRFDVKEIILLSTFLGIVSTAFDFAMFGVFSRYGEASLRTYWFVGSILTELVLIYSIRTRDWFFRVKNMPATLLLVLTFLAGFITILVPFTKFGSSLFSFVTPSADKLALIFVVVVAYLVSTEVAKRLYFKYIEAY